MSQRSDQRVPIVGPCDEAVRFANEGHVPMVFITLPLRADKRMHQILDQFLDSPANLYIIPDIFTFQLMNLNAFQVGGTPVIALSASPMSLRKEILKRAEDLILGTLALIQEFRKKLLIPPFFLHNSRLLSPFFL